MCNDFECIHNHNGMCSFSDEECEGDSCVYWSDCAECTEGSGCFPDNYNKMINTESEKKKLTKKHEKPMELSSGKYVVGEDILAGKYDIIGIKSGNVKVCSKGKDYGDVLTEGIEPGEVTYANVNLREGYTVEVTFGGKVQLQSK